MLPWDQEAVDLLKSWHAAGRSAGEIAQAIGCGRGAVTGKIWRLGLKPNGNSCGTRPSKHGPQRIRKAPLNKGNVFVAAEDRPIEQKPEASDASASRNLTLMQLRDEHCRFPFGNAPPFAFCGHRTAPGSSYCGRHTRICCGPGTISERNAGHVSKDMAAA